MNFADNKFAGTVPPEYGWLTAAKELNLSGNELITGTSPSELGMLTNLEYLGLDGTGLVGQIPPALCQRVDSQLLEIHANCSAIDCCRS